MINRDDMLELTRRMTAQRCCFDRVAGCYLDDEGYIDGAFNIHFLKLSTKEKNYNLKLAKAIPFSKTNEELISHKFPGKSKTSRDMYGLLQVLKECGLKNDELMEIFYEAVQEGLSLTEEYAIFLFHATYDVTRKASDKTLLEDSEEVYDFLIGTVSRWHDDYVVEEPECGFLYPAFLDRSGDPKHICLFTASEHEGKFKKALERLFVS